MIKALLIFFISALSISASTYYPDNVNEIVRERVFEPIKQCLPESEMIKLKGLKSEAIEEIKDRGFYACEDCETIEYRYCYDYIINYLRTDSIFNIISSKDFSTSRYDFRRDLAELFSYEFYRYLTNQSFDVKKWIDSLDKKRLLYESEDIDSLANDSISGVYIPYDLNDAIGRIHIFFCSDTQHLEFIQKTEESAVGCEHLGASLVMRAYWGLHGGSRLWNYFSKLGIKNGDRISSILMHLYYRKIHNLPMNLQELIDEAIKYEIEEQKFLQNQELEDKIKAYKSIEKAKEAIKENQK